MTDGTAGAVTEAPASSVSRASDLDFATQLAIRAGELLVDRIGKVERIDFKSAKDVVTEVDHLSEDLILDAIRAAHPGDGIIAEESGEHVGGGQAPTAGIGRAWIVDPLDGTINYANGIPFFCVSIALVEAGRPVVGVIHDPIRRETFVATEDGPALRDGEPIAASDKELLSDFVVSMALSGPNLITRARIVRKAIRVPRSMGSAALALAYIGNGRFDAFVQESGMSAWDVAAAGLVAERAGATVTAFDGSAWYDPARRTRTVGTIAAPAAFHPRLLALANQR
jgi:myo-inositol-1(or 4)-monophosphatase